MDYIFSKHTETADKNLQ